ncbi:MAG TPA: L,D-transpeptidase [Rhizomicrobium sp.]
MVRVREFAAAAAVVSAVAMGTIWLPKVGPALHATVQNVTRDLVAERDPGALPYVSIPLTAPTGAKPLIVADATDINPDEEGWAVAARLKDYVPRELYGYFDMYLYVSKAAHGPWAQHMFIFHKNDDGDLAYEAALPVSTGRERHEKYFTTTPTGIFQLDPSRFHRVHYSREWHHAAMPWAMFLKWQIHGRMTGIALHSGIGHVAQLGHRASGGCIRLPPRAARLLFKRIQREEWGDVPVFAFDPDRDRTNTQGMVERDANGDPLLTRGYRVLLLVQNYPGGRLEVAEL